MRPPSGPVRPPSEPVRSPSEPETPRSEPETPSSGFLSTKRSPSSTIAPGTHVYAVWFDDDGLVYEVC